MPKMGRTTPCAECPWRRTSRRGYLGADNPVHFFWQSITAENPMPCHMQVDYEDPDWQDQLTSVDLCAGGLIFFRNWMKGPRRPEIAEAVKHVRRSRAVFSTPWEFMFHHIRRAGTREIDEAVKKANWMSNPEGAFYRESEEQ